MEEIKEKILKKRTFQREISSMLLTFFGRGIQACQQLDEIVQQDLSVFPEDFVFVIGLFGSRHPLILQNRAAGLRHVHEAHELFCRRSLSLPSSFRPDLSYMLEIRFKSVEAAWRVTTGKLSFAQAYARHDLLIRGDIYRTMQFLCCVARVENCLFPHVFPKDIRKKMRGTLPNRRKLLVRMIHIKRSEG